MNNNKQLLFLLIIIFFIFILEQRNIKFILLPPPLSSYIQNTMQQYGDSIMLTVIFIFFILIFININDVKFNNNNYVLTKKVVMETMENNRKKDFNADLVKGFCKSNHKNPVELDSKCNMLTEENCNATTCCVYVNKKKCMAGDANGPTFSEDKDGKPFKLDNYYYQDKCFGKCDNK